MLLFGYQQFTSAQVLSDSIPNTDDFKREITDSLQHKKESLQEKIPKMSRKDINISLDSIKKNATTNVDLKSKFKDVNSDSLVKSHLNQHRSKLKNPLSHIDLSGAVVSESYYTNYLDPFSKSELFYSRLYGSPSISIYGLPLKTNFYYTTEDNSFYNSNFFTVEFDIEQFKKQMRQKAKEKLDARIKEQRNSLSNKLDISKQQQIVERQIQRKKHELGMLELNKPDFDFDLDTEKYQDAAKQFVSDSLNSIKDSTQSIASDRGAKYDSVYQKNYQKYQQYQDSINQVRERIAQLESKKTELQAKYSEAKESYERLSDSLNMLKSDINSSDFWLSQAQQHPKLKRAASIVSKIQHFKVGTTNPYFSEYTLNGIPVKGLDLKYEIKSTELHITGGKNVPNRIQYIWVKSTFTPV